MLSLRKLARIPIKSIFCAHLMLFFWVMYKSYSLQFPFTLVCNLLFFVTLFWATENTESDEPLQFALIINLLSIVFDVALLIGKHDELFHDYNIDHGIALVMSLFVRIFTSICLYMIGRERNGAMAKMFSRGQRNVVNKGEAEAMEA